MDIVNPHTAKSCSFQYTGICTFSLKKNYALNKRRISSNYTFCPFSMFSKCEFKIPKILDHCPFCEEQVFVLTRTIKIWQKKLASFFLKKTPSQ